MPHFTHVDADLMRPSGADAHLQQGGVIVPFFHPVFGEALFALSGNPRLSPPFKLSLLDCLTDDPFPLFNSPFHNRKIHFFFFLLIKTPRGGSSRGGRAPPAKEGGFFPPPGGPPEWGRKGGLTDLRS